MASQKVPTTITFRKPGTQPPVFVAGSYSDPQWQPQEMECALDVNAEYEFKAEILADPGATIQYKFRLGHGDWWVLDESVESVTDEQGNRNNVLRVPAASTTQNTENPTPDHPNGSTVEGSSSKTGTEEHTSPQPLNGQDLTPEIRLIEDGPIRSSETIAGWRDPFAGNARSALDDDDWDAQDRVPLFAHECLEASYRGLDRETDSHSLREARHSLGFEHEPDKSELDDPDLEQFPSRLEQISELIHEVEDELEEDETAFEGVPPSAVLGVPRRKTNDFVGDFIGGSPATSPTVSRPVKRLAVPRASMGSVGSDASSVHSLQSIAEGGEEEDLEGEEAENSLKPVVLLPSPVSRPSMPSKTPTSDDDEGVVLESSKRRHAETSKSTRPQDGERTSSSASPKGSDGDLTDEAESVGIDGGVGYDGDGGWESTGSAVTDLKTNKPLISKVSEDGGNAKQHPKEPQASAAKVKAGTARERGWQTKLTIGSVTLAVLGIAIWWKSAAV